MQKKKHTIPRGQINHARGKRATSHLALAHSTPPRNPYIRGGNPKTRGRSPNFQNAEKLHAFWYSWDLSFFLSFFDIFQPRAPLERPLTTHERGRRTPTATTRIAFRLAWCPSWCIFRLCGRLWVGLFPSSHPLATSFKLPGEKWHHTGRFVVLHHWRSAGTVLVWHKCASMIPSIPHCC